MGCYRLILFLIAAGGLIESSRATDLLIERSQPDRVELQWPVGPYDHYLLERTTSPSPSAAVWSTVEGQPRQLGDRWHQEVMLTGNENFFRLRYPTRLIDETAPRSGDTMVNVTRHPVVRFDGPVQVDTLSTQTIRLMVAGRSVPGNLRISSTRRFATFVPDQPLPSSSQVTLMIDGGAILDDRGWPIDGDGDFLPGGLGLVRFQTLPLDRIPGTNVFGFVRDSFTGAPIAGATIRVDAFPEANAITDLNGRFELKDMPAPDFFVHIDGSTAPTPDGMRYPVVGKPFHSSPAETVQLSMDGEPFDIFLPLMAEADAQPLSMTETTAVGMGDHGKTQLLALFPNMDPATWEDIELRIAPGSAIDDQGVPTTTAAVIPVPPDRIPAPLPSNLDLSLVISIQAEGATSFDVPAPVTFPNTDNLAPGSQTYITSFDHAAGHWVIVGTATVSDDGRSVVSDPGVGILAPGWHGISNTGEIDLEILKKPTLASSLTDLATNSIATGLNLASVVVGAVDVAIPESGIPVGQALNILSAGLGTAADLIVNDGELSPDGFTALQIAGYGIVSPEPISGTTFDVAGAGLAIKSTADTTIAAAENLKDLIAILTGSANADWAHSLDDIAAYADDLKAHYAHLEVGVEGLRTFMEAAPQGTSDPLLLESFLQARNSFQQGARFFATEGGGSLESAVQRLSDDLNEWFRHFAELHDHQFEIAANAPFRVTNAEGSEVYRGTTNSEGKAQFLLGAGDRYDITVVDPVFNEKVTIAVGIQAGGESHSIKQYMTPISGPDSDGDGILDEIELVFGTGLDTADSDGDGLDDGTEVRQGFDPLNGRLIGTGVIGSLVLPGPVVDIKLHNELLGLALTDPNPKTGEEAQMISFLSGDPRNPVMLGAIHMGGPLLELRCDRESSRAAVTNGASVKIVDYSDPEALNLIREIEATASSIALDAGILYTADTGIFASFSADSGLPLTESELPEGVGQTLAAAKGKLYLVNGRDFHVYDAAPRLDPATGVFSFPLLGQTELNASKPRQRRNRPLFIGQTHAYIGSSEGYEVVDIRDPGAPFVVGTPAQPQENVQAIASNGSGRVLASTDFSGKLSLFDGRDPTIVTALQSQIDTPGDVRALALGNGVAYLADGDQPFDFAAGEVSSGRGLISMVNYLSPDIQGQPPGVEITSPDSDTDVIEGNTVPIEVQAVDDVHVIQVQLVVDDVVVASDTSFPWDLELPLRPAGSSLKVQARAEDSGGNIGVSESVTVNVLPDVDPPAIESIFPADGSTRGADFRTVQIFFNEPVNVDRLDSGFDFGVRLRNVDSGETLQPELMRLEKLDRLLLLDFPNLLDGRYLLSVDLTRILDRAGNPAARDQGLEWSFTKSTTSAVWIGPGGGSWHDPNGWEGGILPQPGDRVILSGPDDGATVTYSEGDLEVSEILGTRPLAVTGGTLRAKKLETTHLRMAGGELLIGGPIISSESMEIEDGTMESVSLNFSGPSFGRGGTIIGATLQASGPPAPFRVTENMTFTDTTIGADTVIEVGESATLEIRSSFTSHGQLRLLGEEDSPASVFLTGLETCDCGIVSLEGPAAGIDWQSGGEKRLTGDSQIEFTGQGTWFAAGGDDGRLHLGQDVTFRMLGPSPEELPYTLFSEHGMTLAGSVLLASEASVRIETGDENSAEVLGGRVVVDESSALYFASPNIQEGGSLEVRNGSRVELDGHWQGSGILAENATLLLGGQFTINETRTLQSVDSDLTITGRLDLQGEALPDTRVWRLDRGTLANGSIADGNTLLTENLVTLDNMTLSAPLTLSHDVRILNDLTLDANLTLASQSPLPPFVTFMGPDTQTVKGSGTLKVESPIFGGVEAVLIMAYRGEGSLIIERDVIVEGGSTNLGAANRPFILRGTVRAATPGSRIDLQGGPFTNDGGRIEELNGGSVTVNGG